MSEPEGISRPVVTRSRLRRWLWHARRNPVGVGSALRAGAGSAGSWAQPASAVPASAPSSANPRINVRRSIRAPSPSDWSASPMSDLSSIAVIPRATIKHPVNDRTYAVAFNVARNG